MNISDIVLKNGSSTLKNLYPLVKVLTKENKASLAAKGYAPGFTASEWPYDLPAEKIYYSNSLFPGTFYFDDGPVIPIVIDLHIVGSQRMKLQETSEEFCTFVKKAAAKLAAPTLEQVSSYLLSPDDGSRTDVLEAYIRNSTPSPQLYDLFMAYYTMSDYGAGNIIRTRSENCFPADPPGRNRLWWMPWQIILTWFLYTVGKRKEAPPTETRSVGALI